MGGGASVEDKTNFVGLLNTLRNSTDDTERQEALLRLVEACDVQGFRSLVVDLSLGFPSILKGILDGENIEEKKLAAHCCWYLSRDETGRNTLCDPKLDLVPCMIENISWNSCCRFINNVTLTSVNHKYLLSTRLGLVPVLMSRSNEEFVSMLANFTLELKKSNFDLFMSYEPVSFVARVLDSVQADILNSYEAFSIVKFAAGIGYFSEAARALRNSGVAVIMKDMLRQIEDSEYDPVEVIGFRVFVSVTFCNLLGKDEASTTNESFLQQHPEIFDLLLNILNATLDHTSLEGSGIDFGTLRVRMMCSAIRTLSISDTNKPLLLKTNVLAALIRVLKLFTDNAPTVSIVIENILQLAGGGGDDEPAAEVTIEALLQLSFNFEVDDKFRMVYSEACPPGHDLSLILSECVSDPRGKLSDEAKRNASTLLKRFKPPVAAAVATTTAVTEPQSPSKTRTHVMLSYSWAANKHLVVAVGRRLRELGYDVWRDEEGSSVVGPMQGDTDEMMASAIEAAHTVIVFVSPQYKESANCRVEAKYAKQRQLSCPLKLLYVMMSENYHTRSSPPVDGWLALNIGTDLWYPLWNESMIGSTCQALTAVMGVEGGSAAAVSHFTSPTAADVRSSPAHAHPSSTAGSVDWDSAWSMIADSQYAQDVNALKELLHQLGVDNPADLPVLDKEDLLQISQQLRKAKAKRFLAAVGL